MNFDGVSFITMIVCTYVASLIDPNTVAAQYVEPDNKNINKKRHTTISTQSSRLLHYPSKVAVMTQV